MTVCLIASKVKYTTDVSAITPNYTYVLSNIITIRMIEITFPSKDKTISTYIN